MFLSLPGEEGIYRVWTKVASNFKKIVLNSNRRVAAGINPSEKGSYSTGGIWILLMFASNNDENHFDNFEMDGILPVTSMPSVKEAVLMTQGLWEDDKTPHLCNWTSATRWKK